MEDKKYWFPTKQDFKREPIGGFMATKFFDNGMGVIVHKLNYPNLYSITILEGTPDSYQVINGEKISPRLECGMGFTYHEVKLMLRNIQDYVKK